MSAADEYPVRNTKKKRTRLACLVTLNICNRNIPQNLIHLEETKFLEQAMARSPPTIALKSWYNVLLNNKNGINARHICTSPSSGAIYNIRVYNWKVYNFHTPNIHCEFNIIKDLDKLRHFFCKIVIMQVNFKQGLKFTPNDPASKILFTALLQR